MFKDASFWQIIVGNVITAALWCLAMFVLCISFKPSFFSEKKGLYLPREWEKNGKWYAKYLKINVWKDHLPQHNGKKGFSKEHLGNHITVEYIDRFIMETCRGEWDHWMCAMYFFVSLLINPFGIGLILGLLIFIGNLPFIAIQRYNRLRLQILRKRVLREQQRMGRAQNEETVMA